MSISPLAGKPAPKELLIDVAKLEREYHERTPDPGDPDDLAVTLLATLEGALLLAQVHRSSRPIETAVNTLLALAIGR